MDDPEQKILTALVAGATAVASSAVKDSYQGLKRLIVDRFKSKSDIEDAIESVEQKPESEARRSVLAEEIEGSGALGDSEVIAKAEELLGIAAREGGVQSGRDGISVIQTGSGAIAIGRRSTAGGAGAVVIGGNVYGEAFSKEFTKQWKALVRESND
ncbi:MAG: hypothetical protein ABL994_10515 [Verrucomicrobiales bacterium]